MAAVTAAVVAGVATVAATGMQVAQSQGAMGGGGGGGQPEIKKIPMDPNDKAMRDYYARLTVANANTRYPSFAGFTESGGDPAKAQMNVNMPEMKPSEAAALGFTGPHGENIPGVKYEDVASGAQQQLTPEQTMYLAKERARTAQAEGRDTPKWAARAQRLQKRDERLEGRIGALTGVEGKENRLARVTARHEKVKGKLENILHGPTEHQY